MTTNQKPSAAISPPSGWEWESAINHLCKQLLTRQMIRGAQLPAVRIRHQVETDAAVNALGGQWSNLSDAAREESWPDLIQAGYDATKDILPVCVRCGDCCRRSSPTLYEEDLELVQAKLIPVENLVTLRRGEPVRSPFRPGPFHLTEECIKIRERPGTGGCIFFTADDNHCQVYNHRPIQCRAQACWDPSMAEELARQRQLDRRDVFAPLEELMILLAEHERRCSFGGLRQVFDDLEETKGQSIAAVIDAVAFEDHFRHFVAEQLELPPDALDFFFGRSFVELVRLFGFRVEREADGTNILTPLPSSSR